jgi:cell division ATPase FtsA
VNEAFPVDVIGKTDPVKVDERYLAEIIEARLEQIFRKAKDALDEIEALDLQYRSSTLTGSVFPMTSTGKSSSADVRLG